MNRPAPTRIKEDFSLLQWEEPLELSEDPPSTPEIRDRMPTTWEELEGKTLLSGLVRHLDGIYACVIPDWNKTQSDQTRRVWLYALEGFC